jgi:hypothetical protein
MDNFEYKYKKYVKKIEKLKKKILSGGKRKNIATERSSNSRVINYEDENDDIFVENAKEENRKLSRLKLNDEIVSINVGDNVHDFDNTNVSEVNVFNLKGEWKDQVLDGGAKQVC